MSQPFCGRARLRRAAVGTPELLVVETRERPARIVGEPDAEEWANRLYLENREEFEGVHNPEKAILTITAHEA